MVGVHDDALRSSHGFWQRKGWSSIIDVPKAFNTIPRSISPARRHHGRERLQFNCFSGFLLNKGTQPRGRYIVGGYSGINFSNHGFLLSKGTFITIDAPTPGNSEHFASGINPQDDIVGYQDYPTAPFVLHGFLLGKSTFTAIDVPAASSTLPRAISPSGDIVGSYCVTTPVFACHGFLYSNR